MTPTLLQFYIEFKPTLNMLVLLDGFYRKFRTGLWRLEMTAGKELPAKPAGALQHHVVLCTEE